MTQTLRTGIDWSKPLSNYKSHCFGLQVSHQFRSLELYMNNHKCNRAIRAITTHFNCSQHALMFFPAFFAASSASNRSILYWLRYCNFEVKSAIALKLHTHRRCFNKRSRACSYTAVGIAAAAEYIAAEFLEAGGNVTQRRGKTVIKVSHFKVVLSA